MTTENNIREWLRRAKAENATHLIVACDTFEHDDYPVFVKPGEDIRRRVAEYDGKNMQRVMEVYNMSMDLEAQIEATRAYNL